MVKELLAPGHRGCAGCGQAIAVRQVLSVCGENTIVSISTGCLEVMTTAYPQTAWEVPLIHAAFENAAAVAAGIDAGLKVLGKRVGINVLAFAGDGGTFDIGFQALSGMLERRHNVKFICFDNEAYMNTGIQRSGATPYAAWTTTSPPGKYSVGEKFDKKPLARLCAAHEIPYVATATIAYPKDLRRKVEKALALEGPCFLHILTPCPTGWRFASDLTVELSRLAVETGVFVLWEAEGGLANLRVTKKVAKRGPVREYLEPQGRFAHLVRDEKLLAEVQRRVDRECECYGL
jgi:pyruvate ferredoxin oxidoreductase beta subunit